MKKNTAIKMIGRIEDRMLSHPDGSVILYWMSGCLAMSWPSESEPTYVDV